MRAVVLELRDSKAAVLDKEGIVSIIPDQGYRVGQVLELNVSLLSPRESFTRRRTWSRFVAAAAAVLLLFSGAAGGYTAVATPVSSVTVEAEPSVQLNFNVLGRVVSVDALNEKAKDFPGDLKGKVKGKKLEEAVTLTLDFFEEKGFLGTEDDMPLVMTVEGGFLSDAPRMEEVAGDSARQWSDSHPGSLELETIQVTGEMKEEARREGMPPGQMIISHREEMAPGEISETSPVEKEPVGGKPEEIGGQDAFAQNPVRGEEAPMGGFTESNPPSEGGPSGEQTPSQGDMSHQRDDQGEDTRPGEIEDLTIPVGAESRSDDGEQGNPSQQGLGMEPRAFSDSQGGGSFGGNSFGGDSFGGDSLGSGSFGDDTFVGDSPMGDSSGREPMGDGGYGGDPGYTEAGGNAPGSFGGDSFGGGSFGGESFGGDSFGGGGPGGGEGF